jgi:hypothetical protein
MALWVIQYIVNPPTTISTPELCSHHHPSKKQAMLSILVHRPELCVTRTAYRMNRSYSRSFSDRQTD